MFCIEGVLEKITYYNNETTYFVGRLQCKGYRDLVTVVGYLPPIKEGEMLRLTGNWEDHVKYGRQFKVEQWEITIPATLRGLEKYLGSGLIKGVGPVTARRIIDYFGIEALNIIEKDPQRLVEVEGIGDKKATLIARSFREQQEIKNVMLFLQNYGVNPSLAVRLFKHYGHETIPRLKENPYRLAEEVYGIGFKTADKIARQLGLPSDSPDRIKFCIRYILSQAGEEGHVFLPQKLLESRVYELVSEGKDFLNNVLIEEQMIKLIQEKIIFKEEVNGEKYFYLAPFYYAETGIAERIVMFCKNQLSLPFEKKVADSVINEMLQKENLNLTSEQKDVLYKIFTDRVMVITGGPGTGKTTTIKALIFFLEHYNLEVLLAAPTGRAARRMTEATGVEAKTIHRLLEYGYIEGEGFCFQRNEKKPLKTDVIIIDEASMIDVLLMYNLLKAIPPESRLVLVGDIDQLPSVGAGNVLRNLIESGIITCVCLRTIFRQARESMIIINAHRINEGKFPLVNRRERDFYFINEEDPDKIADIIVQLCRERLPRYASFDPMEDLQVLSPMRRTVIGVDNLNNLLQQALNPFKADQPEVIRGGDTFRLEDKVMQIRNNYQKEVYNGDLGRIASINSEDGELVVSYPDFPQPRKVIYDFNELDELVLAYAVSVHKSQGSEYPAIVMPVVTQHYLMLQRNLLYTGITRARRLVVLVGTKKALAIAVKNNRVTERYTYLAGRLTNFGQ